MKKILFALFVLVAALSERCLAAPIYGLGVDTNGNLSISSNFSGSIIFETNAPPRVGTNQIATFADIAPVSGLSAINSNIATRLASNTWALADSTTNYMRRTGDPITRDFNFNTNRIYNLSEADWTSLYDPTEVASFFFLDDGPDFHFDFVRLDFTTPLTNTVFFTGAKNYSFSGVLMGNGGSLTNVMDANAIHIGGGTMTNTLTITNASIFVKAAGTNFDVEIYGSGAISNAPYIKFFFPTSAGGGIDLAPHPTTNWLTRQSSGAIKGILLDTGNAAVLGVISNVTFSGGLAGGVTNGSLNIDAGTLVKKIDGNTPDGAGNIVLASSYLAIGTYQTTAMKLVTPFPTNSTDRATVAALAQDVLGGTNRLAVCVSTQWVQVIGGTLPP